MALECRVQPVHGSHGSADNPCAKKLRRRFNFGELWHVT